MSISQVQLRDGEDCDQQAVLLDDFAGFRVIMMGSMS